MIKLDWKKESYTKKEMVDALEHAALLITQGWESTEDFSISGEEEKEIPVVVEETEKLETLD